MRIFTFPVIFPGHLAVSVLIGAIFGAFWLSLWWFYGIPAISTLLITLTLGYLVAATVFYSGAGKRDEKKSPRRLWPPLLPGDITVFQNEINYWTAFLCIIMFVPIFMVMAAHVVSLPLLRSRALCWLIFVAVKHHCVQRFRRLHHHLTHRPLHRVQSQVHRHQ